MAAQTKTITKPALLRAVDAFQKKHGMSDPTFGSLALNDSGFMTRLRGEGKTFRSVTAEKILAFIEAYRPPPKECPTCHQKLPLHLQHDPDFCNKIK